jgi:hypothetical protein
MTAFPPLSLSSSQEITIYVQCAVEDPENIDITIRFEQISNPVMPVNQNSNMLCRVPVISVS